jgi:hypothetical protein
MWCMCVKWITYIRSREQEHKLVERTKNDLKGKKSVENYGPFSQFQFLWMNTTTCASRSKWSGTLFGRYYSLR